MTSKQSEIYRVLKAGEYNNLKEFLEDKNLLEKWMYNRRNNSYTSHTDTELLESKVGQAINHSFEWAGTPEGHEFWQKLNSEFLARED